MNTDWKGWWLCLMASCSERPQLRPTREDLNVLLRRNAAVANRGGEETEYINLLCLHICPATCPATCTNTRGQPQLQGGTEILSGWNYPSSRCLSFSDSASYILKTLHKLRSSLVEWSAVPCCAFLSRYGHRVSRLVISSQCDTCFRRWSRSGQITSFIPG